MVGEYATEQYRIDGVRSVADLASIIRKVSQDLGWKVRDSPTSSWVVEKGSNLRLRLLGAWLPGGKGNIAIGMTIQVVSNGDEQAVQIEAYDRLGWWIDKELKAETPLDRRVREVLSDDAGEFVSRLQELLK